MLPSQVIRCQHTTLLNPTNRLCHYLVDMYLCQVPYISSEIPHAFGNILSISKKWTCGDPMEIGTHVKGALCQKYLNRPT